MPSAACAHSMAFGLLASVVASAPVRPLLRPIHTSGQLDVAPLLPHKLPVVRLPVLLNRSMAERFGSVDTAKTRPVPGAPLPGRPGPETRAFDIAPCVGSMLPGPLLFTFS